MRYLSICAIYRDEARYLREWIELHKLVGVEHFYLYDNRSTDDHRQVLAPYVEAGLVTVYDWPQFPGQGAAYRHCLERHRDESRWTAFIDLDEFLFSPTLQPVPEILRDYEQWPGVIVNWALFGTSGHETRPDGLVTESYVRRMSEEARGGMSGFVKSIVDPARTIQSYDGWNPHIFEYSEGSPVNEEKEPNSSMKNWPITFSRLRVNHYWTKSDEEFRAKMAVPMAANDKLRAMPKNYARYNEVEDTTITAYAPALRQALEL